MQKLYTHLADYEHVIWDWNGTLLNDIGHAVKTVNRLLQKRRLPLLTEESYKENFHFPIRSYYERLGFDLKNESFEDLCEEFVGHFMNGVLDCPLVPGAFDLLKAIKASGKVQSILSASDQENLDHMIKHFSLHEHLDHVYGIADKFAASKVYRGHELLVAAKKDKAKTVLIGDTDHDLEVGTALGINVILVSHGHQNSYKLRKLHPHVVDTQKLGEDTL
jgi:phosphoglycolate phosphatase